MCAIVRDEQRIGNEQTESIEAASHLHIIPVMISRGRVLCHSIILFSLFCGFGFVQFCVVRILDVHSTMSFTKKMHTQKSHSEK